MWRNLLSCLSLLACASLLLAQAATVEQAWQLAGKGDRAGALSLLAEIVRKTPNDADARLLYGSLLTEAGQGTEAVSQLMQAVSLRPRSAEARNALGEAYNRFKNPSAARACFQKAVTLKPDFADARLNYGQVLVEASDLVPAAEQLDKAIALLGSSPDAADAHYLRAKVYTASGNFMDAAAQLEKAVTLQPDRAEAWSDLGQARKSLLDDPAALSAFEHAVKINPGDSVAQYRLGVQYLEQNELEPAIEHLRQASRLNATDQSTLNSLQIALRRAGKPQEAEQVKQELTTVLRNRDKTDQDALTAVKINNQGAELEKAGNLSAARDKYHQALNLNPSHVGFRVNYAVALLRLGLWTEGLTELREASRQDPANPKIKAALDDAVAQAPKTN